MDLQSYGHYGRKCGQTCVCVYHGLAAIEHLFLFHLMYDFVVFVHMLNWKPLISKQQLGFHFLLLSQNLDVVCAMRAGNRGGHLNT